MHDRLTLQMPKKTLMKRLMNRYRKQKDGAANGKLILAVTGCPTGIAHTYMAAEGLEKRLRQRAWLPDQELRREVPAEPKMF